MQSNNAQEESGLLPMVEQGRLKSLLRFLGARLQELLVRFEGSVDAVCFRLSSPFLDSKEHFRRVMPPNTLKLNSQKTKRSLQS